MHYVIKTLLLAAAAALLLGTAANDSGQPTKQKRKLTGVQGRVYAVGGPAQRIDWTPPPYEHQATISVLDSAERPLKEVLTDKRGKFKILLPPGKYYFIVKESFIPSRQGPVEVLKDSVRSIHLSFDSGIR